MSPIPNPACRKPTIVLRGHGTRSRSEVVLPSRRQCSASFWFNMTCAFPAQGKHDSRPDWLTLISYLPSRCVPVAVRFCFHVQRPEVRGASSPGSDLARLGTTVPSDVDLTLSISAVRKPRGYSCPELGMWQKRQPNNMPTTSPGIVGRGSNPAFALALYVRHG